MPRVVLVPGFSQTATSWRDVQRLLAPTCDVVAIEIPQAETFAATAAAIGARGGRGVYVGYSMGGRLCLRLALDRPDLVRALVLVSASPGISEAGARAERIASDEELAAMIERDGVDAFLDRWLAQPLFAGVPSDAPGLLDRRTLSAASLTHALRTLGTGTMEPLWDRLGELSMPIALVTGTDDPKFDDVARLMMLQLPGAARHVRLDGGHALPLEKPEALGDFVAAFAAEHG